MKAADPRRLSTRGASAYVKIAEGCNRKCSFCVIPELRGLQRSRSVRDVVEEVKRLADSGVLVLDCRFDLARPEAGEAAWREPHIPGAVYAHLERDLSGPITPS